MVVVTLTVAGITWRDPKDNRSARSDQLSQLVSRRLACPR